MFELTEKKLTEEQVKEIASKLAQAGQGEAADLLTGHIAALREELTVTSQYYEEFYIPVLEGRDIQSGSPPRWHKTEEGQKWLRGKLP